MKKYLFCRVMYWFFGSSRISKRITLSLIWTWVIDGRMYWDLYRQIYEACQKTVACWVYLKPYILSESAARTGAVSVLLAVKLSQTGEGDCSTTDSPRRAVSKTPTATWKLFLSEQFLEAKSLCIRLYSETELYKLHCNRFWRWFSHFGQI